MMRRALDLAERGRGRTSPNPVVGAVIVRDGRVVGEGFHRRYGGPHAEVNALAEAGEAARGGTLYVTLEPCCVWGNTPPCTDAIRSSGIARVVVPMEDPNPHVSGRGIAELRRCGVSVEVGLLAGEAAAANAPYLKFRATGLPLITLKMALSLDGRTAAPEGAPRWLSCDASRERVHAMRAASDCVMIGVGTVLADDPRLTDRRPAAGERQPARLVLDSHLRTPPNCALVAETGAAPTIVACGEDAAAERRRELEARGAAVWPCRSETGRVDLRDVLRRAAAAGMISVLCEGGPTLATSLLSDNIADRVAFFVAPIVIGDEGAAALGRLGRPWWTGERALVDAAWSVVGDDVLLEANVSSAWRPSCSQGS
ncbi:MAG: bifunctional diaminohydroxyphosphoribosylaminopyrimidine deaminase/5-amino-6-(5-phosphoribosylamino)uracil reductase RibD [Candidatus Eisenbacteria bacterium]|nr:bifunctional diaminohydroxyphosphoribosylaminopyrimidine deaminase/5-amino-6-(5-phosphoribosylamino)uracil reductase RibD [Candidatus Eisenbacteria bacterium]